MHRRPGQTTSLLHAAMLCATAAVACAAEDPPLWSGALEVGAFRAAPSAGPDGELAVDESLLEVRTYWQPRLGVRLGVGAGGGYQRYDGEPVTADGRSVWLRVPATVMWSPHWGFTSLSSIGSATEEDVAVRDGRRWQVEAGVLWVHDADLLIAVTAVVNSRLERSPQVFPLISMLWKINDAWSLTIVDEIDNISRFTRTFDDGWAASVLVDVRFFEYALDDGNGGPAVLDDERAIIGLEGAWRPWRDARLALRPFVGAVVARHVTLLDADGEQVSSSWQSSVVVAGLSLRSDF